MESLNPIYGVIMLCRLFVIKLCSVLLENNNSNNNNNNNFDLLGTSQRHLRG